MKTKTTIRGSRRHARTAAGESRRPRPSQPRRRSDAFRRSSTSPSIEVRLVLGAVVVVAVVVAATLLG